MASHIKNIEQSVVFPLVEQVAYLPGQIVSKTLGENKYHSFTLFTFD